MNLSWEWVGGFFDGEASFRNWYVVRTLHVIVEVTQKEREILEDIKQFLNAELNIYAGIYYLKPFDTWRLFVSALEDAALLSVTVYPHLRHPKRKLDCQDLITTARRHAQQRIPEEQARHRIKLVQRYRKVLEITKQPHFF